MKKETMTNVEEFANELKLIKQQYEAVVKAELSNVIKPMFKEFIEKNPEIESVSWPQYTPYFNDGDECVFSRYDMELIRGGELFQLWDLDKKKDKKLKEELQDLSAELSVISDEAFKIAFGDHCRVTYTLRDDSFSVDDYDHD